MTLNDAMEFQGKGTQPAYLANRAISVTVSQSRTILYIISAGSTGKTVVNCEKSGKTVNIEFFG